MTLRAITPHHNRTSLARYGHFNPLVAADSGLCVSFADVVLMVKNGKRQPAAKPQAALWVNGIIGR
jgi:hypothetical protein